KARGEAAGRRCLSRSAPDRPAWWTGGRLWGRPKDRWRPEAAGRIQRNWPAGRVRPVRRKEHGLSVEAEPAMYTVVLMAALAGGGESPALFHGNGCCGGYSCHGCNGGCHGGGFFHGG